MPMSDAHGIRAADERRMVRLSDGRLATLFWWPIPVEKRSHKQRAGRAGGARAKVRLPSGKVLSVDPQSIEEVGT